MSENSKLALLVDDDPDFLFQQKLMLEKIGYRVETAASRPEAQQMLENLKPDLAVLDLMMDARDDGFVLARHIKKSNPAVPVIIVSAVTSETGIDFGAVNTREKQWIQADAVLAKPVRLEQLVKEINRLQAV